MKIWKLIIPMFVLLMLAVQPVEAQFLKKLAKRAQKGAENAVIRKTEEKVEEKAEEQTEKAIDKIFEAAEKDDVEEAEKKEDSNHKETPRQEKATAKRGGYKAVFNFDWKYTLRMESADSKRKQQDGDLLMTYYLSSKDSYVGFRPDVSGAKSEAGNMLMVMDEKKGDNYIFMNLDGRKIVKKMPADRRKDNAAEKREMNYKITKIGTKTILGYHCQGYRMETEDGVVTTYIAKNAPVAFKNAYGSDPNSRPKGFDPRWLKEFENGLMMEMDFKSSKKDKYDFKTTCVGLDKENLSINAGDYSTSFFGR